MIPLSLYVHLPWCVSRCPYCDFNAHAAASFDEARYTKNLIHEIVRLAQPARGRILESIFFGGGTPSRFSPTSIRHILETVRDEFACSETLEVTLEANPQSADRRHFCGYREAGVNRLSIGVQSFHAQHLRAIGRAHDVLDAQQAIRDAQAAGFTRFNIDLMYGLPNQSVEEVQADLEQALSFTPEHVSWYQLTLEPGTPFAKRPPVLPDPDILWQMHEAGAKVLEHAGFEQYEVSAWSRENAVCRHNVNYWEYGDYLGVGAGAHGKWTDVSGVVWRTEQVRDPQAWMAAAEQGHATAQRTRREGQDRMFEFMLGALRLRSGFLWETFESRTRRTRRHLASALEQVRALGLIEENPEGLRASSFGWRRLDDLCELFLPEKTAFKPPLAETLLQPVPRADTV